MKRYQLLPMSVRLFFSRPLGAWILTVAAACGLLAVGVWVGRTTLTDGKQGAETRLLQGQSVELQRRVGILEMQLDASRQALAACQDEHDRRRAAQEARQEQQAEEPAAVQSRALRRGEAVDLLGGAITMVFEGSGGEPPQAVLRIRTRDGLSGTAALRPGGEALVRLEGKVYRLRLKKLTTSSAIISLLPEQTSP